jgi:3-deoxy-manno-octulosonate cytidylyltransferase (CMP-KDO synthetase)
MKTAAVIPARFASTRFPAKMLAPIKGKPLILHVVDKVKKCKKIDIIAVAADDERIVDCVKGICPVFMTSPYHRSGTDRIAEVAESFLKDVDIFINVQGDEPAIDPMLVDALAEELIADHSLNAVTAYCPFSSRDLAINPNNVKVVFDKNNYALYFSRSLIPYDRDGVDGLLWYKHIGVYGYRREFLLDFVKMPPSLLEQTEKLEQLRILDNGYKMKVIRSAHDSIGVDEPEDIKKVEAVLGE